MLTPGKAVAIGHATITAPSILIMLGCGLAVYLLSANLFSQDAWFAGPTRLLVCMAISCPLAWWWWRRSVHRWRRWLQGQQIDPERLEKLAVRTLLVWPNRWFERSA